MRLVRLLGEASHGLQHLQSSGRHVWPDPKPLEDWQVIKLVPEEMKDWTHVLAFARQVEQAHGIDDPDGLSHNG